jgi:hypothetical protein
LNKLFGEKKIKSKYNLQENISRTKTCQEKFALKAVAKDKLPVCAILTAEKN